VAPGRTRTWARPLAALAKSLACGKNSTFGLASRSVRLGTHLAAAGNDEERRAMLFELPRKYVALLVIAVGLWGTTAFGQQTVDTCGSLVQGSGCVLFQADSGGSFVLDTIDGFAPGDRVHVEGTTDVACVPSCLSATGCITVSTIGPCAAQFSACGTLVQIGVCVLFQTDNSATYVLDQMDGFFTGDRVQVTGTLDPNCVHSCSPTNGCVTVSAIVSCATPFSTCGVLTQRAQCVAFVADTGGTFTLETVGGFVAGDRVRVTGTVDTSCARACQPTDGCITSNTIESCGTAFNSCGMLIQGPGCVLFQADTGGTFTLSNVGAFVVGDRVRVTGALGGSCTNACTATETCIADNLIEACQSSFAACGKLIQGASCVLFQADTSATYVLDNTDGFVVGTRVRVAGTLDATCVSTCLAGSGCIHNNTITAGTTVCLPAPTPVCAATSTGLIALSLLGLLRRRV
jgi:hypothetical protein